MRNFGPGDVVHDLDEISGRYLNPPIIAAGHDEKKNNSRMLIYDSTAGIIIIIGFMFLMSIIILNTSFSFVLMRPPIMRVFSVNVFEEDVSEPDLEPEPEPDKPVIGVPDDQPQVIPDVFDEPVTSVPLGTLSDYTLPEIPDLPIIDNNERIPKISEQVERYSMTQLKPVPVSSSIDVDSIGVDTFATIGLPYGSTPVGVGTVTIPQTRHDTVAMEEPDDWGKDLEPHVYRMVDICLRSCMQSLFMYDARLANEAAVSDWLTVHRGGEINQLEITYRGKAIFVNIILSNLADDNSSRFFYFAMENNLSREYKNDLFRKLTLELTSQLNKENCLKQIE
jgi:hypothetical protein